MNRLLENYRVDVDFPDVSGIEHLQMLKTRSELAKIEQELTPSERKVLAEADRKLVMAAGQFFAELARFIDFAEERQRRKPGPNEWWWYLDILVQIPALPERPLQAESIPV
jgi:hypothetical protein